MKLLKTYNHFISKVIKNTFTSFIFIFCINYNNIAINSFITLPFTYINKKTNNSNPVETTPKDYFESFINNSVYSTIKINNKDINFHLSTERYTIYVSDKALKAKQTTNIVNNTNLFSLEYIGISEAQLTTDTFNLLLNNTNNIEVENISFFIAHKFYNISNNFQKKKSLVSETDEIGFNIYKGNPYEKVEVGDDDDYEDFYSDIFDFDDNETETNETEKSKDKNKLIINGGYTKENNTNLINQLKSKNIISSYSFLVQYNNANEEKGKIIIGGLPHEYDPGHFSEDFLVYDFVPMDGQPPYNWHFFFEKITYGNKSVADDKNLTYYRNVAFSLDFGFILASYRFKDFFYDNFFDNYKDSCFEEYIDNSYYIGIYCKEEVVKNFQNLSFYLSKAYNPVYDKIEFDYKDLFIKSKNNPKIYYFQIVFVEYSNKWILGRPLFKKYPTIFDQSKKIIGFYLESGHYDISNNNGKKSIPWQWIIIIFLGVCVIVLSIILYKVIPLISKRKKKANELDDDFNYEPQGDKVEPNEDKKLFKD